VTLLVTTALRADTADQEFAYAEALSQRGLDALAIIVMDKFTRDFPDHPRYEEALLARARYQQKMGDVTGSLAALEEFLAKHSYSRLKLKALCRSAELCYDLGRWRQAADKLQTLLADKEQLSAEWLLRARYYLAWCRAEMGECEDALNRFRDFAALCPDTDLAMEARLAVGDCMRRLKRYEDAFAAYGRVMAEAKGELSVSAAFGMGIAALEANQYRRAAVGFGEALRRGPRSALAPKILWYRAECLNTLGDKAAARACLSQIVTEFPNDTLYSPAFERIGELLRREPTGLKGQPAPFQQVGTGPAPSDIELYSLALAQIRAKDLKEAGDTIDRLSKNGAKTWAFRARLGLAVALEKEGKISEAASCYAQTQAEDAKAPVASTCLLRAADLDLKCNESDKAASLLSTFITTYPQDERANIARWNLAQLQIKEQRYAEAAKLLEEVGDVEHSAFRASASRETRDLRLRAAASNARRQKTSSALSTQHSALLREAAIRAGLAWIVAEEDEKAVAAFKRGLAGAPGACPLANDPEVLFAYAEALARTGSIGQAVEVLRQITNTENRDRPHFLWANYRLGVMCERAGAWEEAVSAFTQVDRASAPASARGGSAFGVDLRADALLHRAIAFFRAGRPEECASSLVQLMKRYPSKALPLCTYAWLAAERLQSGDVARAELVCDVLTERAGQKEEYRAFAKLLQARCAMALRNWQRAADILQALLAFPNPKSKIQNPKSEEPGRHAPGPVTLEPELEYAAKRALADCLHELRQDAEAVKLLHELASQSRGRAAAEAEVALAQRFQAMGRPPEAAAVFRHVLLLFDVPSMRDIVVASCEGLAQCEEAMGRHGRARVARARLAELTGNGQSSVISNQ
jgi:tetratricopeptide (TPR) repeat protein